MTRRSLGGSEWSLELPIALEFIYAFGQWRAEVLAVSNNGRVARFDGKGWTTLRVPPVPAVSYQVYAILTYYDRLLLGQYPTGEVIEYAGKELKQLKGWPPVMPGVSPSARELQTLAIYGGDVYAGVWPWAEVWRYDRDRDKWAFTERMFHHPLPTDAVVHPYETETLRVDPVGNLWGQRVTGLCPHGAGLDYHDVVEGQRPLGSQVRVPHRATAGGLRGDLPGHACRAAWRSRPSGSRARPASR